MEMPRTRRSVVDSARAQRAGRAAERRLRPSAALPGPARIDGNAAV